MTIQIPVSNELETRLRQRAGAVGKDLSTFVAETLAEKVADHEESAAMARSADSSAERWVTEFEAWVAH